MDEKKMFDKAKKPITRGYADHKITTLQEGFAATNNLADLEEIKVPENCNVCDDGSTPITDDLFELAHHDTSEAERIVLTDTFDPILKNIAVTFNGTAWTAGAQYTYGETTGVFATLPGQITVPAAQYTQNENGTWTTTPGTAEVVITGTV